MFLFFNKTKADEQTNKKKQPEIVASLFLSFLKISGSCFYKIVLLKKRVLLRKCSFTS